MLRRAVVSTALLAAIACGTEQTSNRKTPPSIAAERVPSDARRGPILLRFNVTDPEKVVRSMRLEWRTEGDWKPATATVEPTATGALVMWDSFKDITADTTVALRFVAAGEDVLGDTTLAMAVRNDPETNRILLAGQPLKELDSGGVNASGTGLGVLVWSSREGKVVGDSRRIEVGRGPVELRPAPHGRVTAILEDEDWGVSIVRTPLTATATDVEFQESLKLPYGVSQGVRWSADGRYLYVTGHRDGDQPATLWRYEPAEDLSTFGQPTALATLPGPPSRFDVDRTTGQILAACGSGGVGVGKIVLYAADGKELARIEEEMDFANALVIHPMGGLAIWTGDFTGDRVRRFRFDATSLTQQSLITSIQAPTEVVFHPASPKNGGSALISNAFKDTVTPIELGEDGERIGFGAGKVPLASEMDLIERGSMAGSTFVAAVTQIYRVALNLDGTAENKGVVHDFGEATEQIINGVGVQR